MASSSSEITANVFTDETVTYQEKNEYKFTWTITNLQAWLTVASTNSAILSSVFPTGGSNVITWRLKFVHSYPHSPFYCSLLLVLQPHIWHIVKAKYELSMINSKNVIIASFSGEASCSSNKDYGSSSFIIREKLLDKTLFPDDMLKVGCKITATVGFLQQVHPGTVQKWQFPSSELIEGLSSLLESDKYGDVTITVADQKFTAYKGILATRSPVFAAMFSVDMQESAQNAVTISDTEPAVFGELLRYIYTGQVNELSAMAFQLYAAADKYELISLKTLCREAIMSGLTLENVAETFKFADVYSDDGLKKCAIKFLSSGRAIGVTETAGWKDLAATNLPLAWQVIEAMAAKLPSS